MIQASNSGEHKSPNYSILHKLRGEDFRGLVVFDGGVGAFVKASEVTGKSFKTKLM